MKRLALILSLLCGAAGLFVACGGIPSNGVAKVDDQVVTKDDFNKWLAIAQKQQSQQQPGAPAASKLVPPDFKACVAAAQEKDKRTPAAALKAQCKQQYNLLKDQVMQFLVNADWIQGEASDRGIEASDAAVAKEFKKTKDQFFKSSAEYQKFLKDSGQTEADVKFRVKLQLLSDKIRKQVTKSDDKVTQAEIAAYYKKNEQQFGTPETRDFNVVVTKTKAQADAAKARLEAGESFKTVAKDVSIDKATKNNGGKLAGVTEGQIGGEFDKVAFSAPKGKVLGPVKTPTGYYVFETTKVTKGNQQSLAEATPQIRQQIKSQSQQKQLDKFVKDFQKKWKDKTDCRKGYVIQDCKNAPKPKTNTGGVPGVPGQGQQGAPSENGGSQPTPTQP